MSAENLFEVSESTFEDQVINSDVPVIVDFWADWCAPCRMVAPVLEEIAEDYAGDVKVAKLNVDANRKVANRYDIMSIPTVILFREGKQVKQVVGALPKELLVKELGLNQD